MEQFNSTSLDPHANFNLILIVDRNYFNNLLNFTIIAIR